LMKKLKSGSVNKNTVKTASPGSAAFMKSFGDEVAQNVQDELSGKIKFDEPVATMRRGGMVRRKMQAGGMTNKIPTAKGARLNPIGRKTAMTALGVKKKSNEFSPSRFGEKANPTTGSKMMKGGSIKAYKTGGMVNSNSKVSAIKSAGSKGVKTGANTRISASKIARGRVGGTSTAPRTATPKAMYGMSMKPGMMRKGGTKKR